MNIYQYPLAQGNDSEKKKTLSHKKKITAMCLSTDGRSLISGDAVGQIYIWSFPEGTPSLRTFDLHKDKGPVTNLVALTRPLSLFGLTANMQNYEPGDFKAFQKQVIDNTD